jgi:hypothetical protein
MPLCKGDTKIKTNEEPYSDMTQVVPHRTAQAGTEMTATWYAVHEQKEARLG